MIKRNGTYDTFDINKILSGIEKSAKRTAHNFSKLDDNFKDTFVDELFDRFVIYDVKDGNTIQSYFIENCVDDVLGELAPEIKKTYDNYNFNKSKYADSFMRAKAEVEETFLRGDRTNANTNSQFVSTKRCIGYNIFNKEMYQMDFLTPQELQECRDGYIYIHDMVARKDSHNCFSRDTRFITSEGVKSFYDFMPGDKITVLTHNGNWKPAIVKSYGRQKLQKITFKRGKCFKDVYATPNHRWILNDGSETTDLKVGDRLISAPNVAEYDWNKLTRENKKLWCLGFAFADGSVRINNSMPTVFVRLCGHKNEYANRFEEAGYHVTYPESFMGDGCVMLLDIRGKTLPLLKINYENCKYFIDGYLCADGNLNKNTKPDSKFRSVQCTGYNNTFLYDLLNVSGQYVSSVKDLSGQVTNYGQRSAETYTYRINSNHRKPWKVHSIEEPKSINAHAQVWCLEVEDDHSFILEGGIPTGNCCLVRMSDIVDGGFVMGDMDYTEPTRLDSAFNVILAVTKSAAAQQYGGFTIPRFDTLIAKYAEKEYTECIHEYFKFVPLSAQVKEIAEKAEDYAIYKVRRALEQGFQAMEYDLNTVGSSRGDYPFVTITFGLDTSRFGKMAVEALLDVRKNGEGIPGKKKIVAFPKLVFLYDEELHGEGGVNHDLYLKAVECESKAMYPDRLSLTGEGYVASIYKKYKLAISPMGCRAFLSPWYERGGMHPADDDDVPVFEGRANIGAISLNLPMIYQKAKDENRDFYEVLDEYMEMIRDLHLRTYEYLGKMKAGSNPLMFCEGGLYGGHLKPDEPIAPLLKSWTASFGVTALNELQVLYNGKTINEDGEFALEVMKHINDLIEKYKKIDNRLYACYGTPAENLCGVQCRQFRKKYGIIKGVSDKEYFTNSFHCPVYADITPFEKQDSEKRFWDYFNGGKIQYVRYHTDVNLDAFDTVNQRGMKLGFYQGHNLKKCYCADCGYEELEMEKCPNCGSRNLSIVDRVCGYLGYTAINGSSRMNDAKLAEIADRISM